MQFDVLAQDPKSKARVGRFRVGEMTIETPSYVVVGTNGYIRTLEPEDIPKTGTQMVIANTYHLWRELGEEGLASYPGLHEAMEWKDGIIMTDSGGFQVFSMGASREHAIGKMDKDKESDYKSGENIVRVTDAGVYFNDDGEEKYLDAELSMRIQEQLDADIIFAFDEPSSPKHDKKYTRLAMERTHKWAERCLEAKTSEQMLFGIVQGGGYEDLRTESAKFIGSLPFHGFGIGGAFSNSFGDSREKSIQELGWVIPHLPQDKPRHFLGIGRIEDVFLGVEAGIDTFDCVIPTREARHGALWTMQGRLDIGGKGKYKNDDGPIDEGCGCYVCATEQVSRRELHALFKDKDPKAGRLATMHNVHFFNHLMEEVRDGIRMNALGEVKKRYLK